MIAIPRNWLTLGAVLVLGIIVAGSVPPPAEWGGERTYDVAAVAEVEWHSFLEKWTINELGHTEEASKWLNIGAWFTNLLFLSSSESQTVSFTLTHTSGTVLEVPEQQTGKGSRLGTTTNVKVVFREVPTGDYDLKATITDQFGKEITKTTRIHVGGPA